VLKNTAIHERMQLQFRAEIFNILNRANFNKHLIVFATATNPTDLSGTAGTITSTSTTTRQVQFGIEASLVSMRFDAETCLERSRQSLGSCNATLGLSMSLLQNGVYLIKEPRAFRALLSAQVRFSDGWAFARMPKL
jgi:hypothetical protein